MKGHRRNIFGLSAFVMTAGFISWNFFFIVFHGQTVIGSESFTLNLFEFIVSLAVTGLAIERFLSYILRR